MLTPSLVIVGAPHFFSSTTLRPLGPSVTLTASARMFMPRSRPRRASSSNAINLAMRCRPLPRGCARLGGRSAPATDDALEGTSLIDLGFELALTVPECQFRFSTHP